MARPQPCQELIGLSGPFTKIARAMSRQWNVRIIPTGAKCSTDGESIKIPFTADHLPLEARQALHGMLDHEVSHVAEERRHKEAGKPSPIALFRAEKEKRLRGLINVFEDIRIETRYSAIYPGMGENLNACNLEAANEWARVNEDQQRKNWWGAFGSAIILKARGQECDWADEGEIGEYLELCAEEIERSTSSDLEWVTDAIDLANRVFDKVKDRHEEKKEEQKEKGEGEEGDGEEGDDEVDCDETEMSPDDEADVEDFGDLTREKMEADVIEDADRNQRYIPHPKAVELDRVTTPEDGGSGFYLSARMDVQAQIGALRSKQRSVIQSWSRRRVLTGLDSGFIDEDVLSEVKTGNRRVFSDFSDKRDLNTVILQLVDCSGSMGSNTDFPELTPQPYRDSAYFASRTAIALTEAWSGLGVPNEVLGFTVDDFLRTQITQDDVLNSPFFCRSPLIHFVFKSFDEKLKPCRGRFAHMRGHGSNVDGEAVAWAARRLAARKERRKILVVTSDGCPLTSNGANPLGNANHTVMERHLRETITAITSSGIEVIGIGAGTRDPGRFYNEQTGAKFIPVMEIGTMATDIFRVMKKRLARGMAA